MRGGRVFHAVFAGSVAAVLAGVVGGALVALLTKSVLPAAEGWTATLGGLVSAVLSTPWITAQVLNANRPKHLSAAYAFTLIAVVLLGSLTYLFVPLVQAVPTALAAASVAGIRWSQSLDAGAQSRSADLRRRTSQKPCTAPTTRPAMRQPRAT